MTASRVRVISRERLISAVRAASLVRPCSTTCQTTTRHQKAINNPYTVCVRLVIDSCKTSGFAGDLAEFDSSLLVLRGRRIFPRGDIFKEAVEFLFRECLWH